MELTRFRGHLSFADCAVDVVDSRIVRPGFGPCRFTQSPSGGPQQGSSAARVRTACTVHPGYLTKRSIYEIYGYFKSGVANAAYEACGLKAEKSSLPAMRNSTVRMVLKLAYPRALRLAA